MSERDPSAELCVPFSSAGAVPHDWVAASRDLAAAEVYWLTTVRPDSLPHVTPLVGVWREHALYFCTGPTERKARNLEANTWCVMTTGNNTLDGLDLVVEGSAEQVNDAVERGLVAESYESKYGAQFTAPEGTWYGLADALRVGDVLLFRVAPVTAFGFGKGAQYSQTRWQFS